MTRSVLAALLFASLSIFGCERTKPSEASAGAKLTGATEHAGHEHEEGGEGCSEAATETRKLQHANFETVTAPDGTRYVHIGAAIDGVEEVTVAELTAAPDKWVGKQVRVSGDISAMCDHKRAWFAVVNVGDQSGTQLQVKTAPAFLVPEGSVGKRARAVGVVEVVEVPAAEAKHLEADHKITAQGEPAAASKQVVIRASGADFI